MGALRLPLGNVNLALRGGLRDGLQDGRIDHIERAEEVITEIVRCLLKASAEAPKASERSRRL
jgi:hypothetical protein